MTDLAERHDTRAVAVALDIRIRETVRGLKVAWVRLAEDLFDFAEGNCHEQLGYSTFEEWLADPDVDVERRWAYQLIATWRELVINRKADPALLEAAQPAKLQEVLPAVRRGQVTLEEALADAGALSRADLREKYVHNPQNGRSINEPWDAEGTAEWGMCHACGSRYRVSG